MKHTLKYYVKYLPLIILALVLMLGQAYFDLALPEYMTKIVSDGIGQRSISKIWQLGGIMLLYSLGVTACSIGVGFLAAHIGTSSSRDMRKDVFMRVSDFSNAEYDKFTVSSLITRSTNDITQVQLFVIMLVRIVLYAPILAIGGIIKAVKMSSGVNQLAVIIIVAVVVMLVVVGAIMLIVQPRFIKLQKMLDELNLVAREGLNGMLVVRAFNTQEHEEKRFNNVNKKLTGANLFVNRVMNLMMPMMMLIMNGVSITVLWVVSSTAQNTQQVINMMAFIQYSMQIIMSFMMLTMVFVIMPRAIVSAKRIGEVVSQPISIKTQPGSVKAENIKGEIEFVNVGYSYATDSENAIEGISFKASPGTTTAIIGSTGSGKSTLISLIPRLHDATAGDVLLDGVSVKNYTLDSLRDAIAYVPQKNMLFSGTIKSNIKYWDENGTDERMEMAAETAQSNEFILSKDKKFESEITQGGTNVSGGQKQRIAIARALYKLAPVYVFDDSFSALDFKTDANLRAALKDKVADSTVIIVAQRVGTIKSADQILVLDEGKLVGKGTHKELMETCSVYSDIAHSQLSKEELA